MKPPVLPAPLVRVARRMADRRHADWMAVYVETPRHHRLSDADRDRAAQTLRAPLWHLNAYLGSALAVVLAGLIAKLIESFLPLPNLSIVFLTAVLFSAVSWGLRPAIVAAILSVLVYDFGFHRRGIR